MKATFEKKAKWIGLPLLAAFLFVAYSYLPLTAPARDNSPDESANRFFSQEYARTGRLWAVESLNYFAPGLIHPRSTRVDDLFILPGGFLGQPVIYGGLGRMFGVGLQPFLTALFAVFGLAAFGLAVGRQFGARYGWLAGLLLAVQPNWWYQASRPFMPNGLLVSLLLLSAGFLWGRPFQWLARRRPSRRSLAYLDSVVAGLLLGLALAVRPPAVYWLAIFGLIVWGMNGWRRRWIRAVVVAGSALFVLLPFLVMNQAVYGSWLASGYGADPLNLGAPGLPQGFGAKLIGPLGPYLFPLGFAPRTALKHFWQFGLNLYGWWWWLVLAALLWMAVVAWRRRRPRPWYRFWRLRKAWSRPAVSLAVAGLVVTGWLILFYGSWTVYDNPDPKAVTIGASYLRYWLPISVLGVLPLAWALNRLGDLAERRWRVKRRLVIGLALILLAAAGAGSAFLAPQEGLKTVRLNLYRYDALSRRINSLTGPNDLIVVDRDDKFFFPGRAVMQPLRSEANYQALPRLVRRLGQVYYLGITFPAQDFNWLNAVKLSPLGLRIEPMAEFGEETLYRFVSNQTQ